MKNIWKWIAFVVILAALALLGFSCASDKRINIIPAHVNPPIITVTYPDYDSLMQKHK